MSVSVPEDVEMGYHIATMLATDRDVGDNVTLVSEDSASLLHAS